MLFRAEKTQASSVNKKQNPFQFTVILGANGKMRISDTLKSTFVFDVVDHKQYDVFYLIAILVSNSTKSFQITTTLSNDAEELEKKMTTYYIIIGSVVGVIVVGFFICGLFF